MGIFNKLFGSKRENSNTKADKNLSFTPSDNLMDEEKFWAIIETTKNIAGDNYGKQQKQLESELRKLTPDDLILFGNRFRYFRGEANTWELWGAIYIVHGGCGDDSFNDFREWVIAQGKDFYYKTIRDPETLADIDHDKIDIDWEGMGYVPSTVFEEMTGQDMPYPFQERDETTGTEWEEESDELKKMFPRLSAKYPDHV